MRRLLSLVRRQPRRIADNPAAAILPRGGLSLAQYFRKSISKVRLCNLTVWFARESDKLYQAASGRLWLTFVGLVGNLPQRCPSLCGGPRGDTEYRVKLCCDVQINLPEQVV